MFGRATIRLGIGPHSSLGLLYVTVSLVWRMSGFVVIGPEK